MVPAVTRAGQTKAAKLGQGTASGGTCWFCTSPVAPVAEKPRAHISLAAPGVDVETPEVCAVLLGSRL